MAEEQIGVVTHFFGKISVGLVELSAALRIGDTIHIKGAHDDFTQEVSSMRIEYDNVEEGKPGDIVGIKLNQKVHANDKVYKICA